MPVTFEFDNNPKKNVQKLSYIEIPFEIRWRTSKVHSHKFWRIYSGVKYSYLLVPHQNTMVLSENKL